MRVLHISHLFPCYEGDLNGIAIQGLIEPLLRMGIEMQMICPIRYVPRVLVCFRPDLSGFYKAPYGSVFIRGMKTHYVRYMHWGSRQSLTPKAMAWAIDRYASDQLDIASFDMIHTHKSLPDGLAAVTLAVRYNKPLILTVRDTDLQPRRYKKRLENLLRSAQALATPSEMIRAFVENEFHLPIQPIYNGINIDEIEAVEPYPRVPSQKNDFIMLSVSTLIPRKGIQYNLMALRELVPYHAELKYLIVGDGPYRKELEAMVRDFGLTERVDFVGQQPRAHVYAYMKMCDLFCMPSWNETFGLVYLEAMACGLPIIATKGHGIDGVIQNGKEGVLVEEKSAKAIAEVVSWLIDNPDTRRNIAKQGREQVCRSLTWEASARKLLELYQTLV